MQRLVRSLMTQLGFQSAASRAELLELIQDLTEPTDCCDGCTSVCHRHHWYETDPPCPQLRAKALLIKEGMTW